MLPLAAAGGDAEPPVAAEVSAEPPCACRPATAEARSGDDLRQMEPADDYAGFPLIKWLCGKEGLDNGEVMC